MIDSGTNPLRAGFLILLGILSALLFIAAAGSVIVRGLPGVLLAAGSGFAIGFFATVARRRRPSLLWGAVLAGSVVGAVVAVTLVREFSLQPRHPWNDWVLFMLPIGALCGSVLASTRFAAGFLDRL